MFKSSEQLAAADYHTVLTWVQSFGGYSLNEKKEHLLRFNPGDE